MQPFDPTDPEAQAHPDRGWPHPLALIPYLCIALALVAIEGAVRWVRGNRAASLLLVAEAALATVAVQL